MSRESSPFAGWHGLEDSDIRSLVESVVKKYRVPASLHGDAVSEACLGFVEASGIYEPDRGLKFSTIGVKYARSRVYRMIRSECRRTRRFDLSFQGSEDCFRSFADHAGKAPDEIVSDRELGGMVSRMVDGLPEDHRKPMLAAVVGGMTYREVGESMGVDREAIKSRVVRDMVKIREEMNRRTA